MSKTLGKLIFCIIIILLLSGCSADNNSLKYTENNIMYNFAHAEYEKYAKKKTSIEASFNIDNIILYGTHRLLTQDTIKKRIDEVDNADDTYKVYITFWYCSINDNQSSAKGIGKAVVTVEGVPKKGEMEIKGINFIKEGSLSVKQQIKWGILAFFVMVALSAGGIFFLLYVLSIFLKGLAYEIVVLILLSIIYTVIMGVAGWFSFGTTFSIINGSVLGGLLTFQIYRFIKTGKK